MRVRERRARLSRWLASHVAQRVLYFLFGSAYAGLPAAFHLERCSPRPHLPIAGQLPRFVLDLSKHSSDPAPEGIRSALPTQVFSPPVVLEGDSHRVFFAP